MSGDASYDLSSPKKQGQQEDNLSQASEGDEDEAPLPSVEEIKDKLKNRNSRTSVSAEAYGEHNPKGEFKPKIVEKGEEQKNRIWERLSQAFMFNAIDDADKRIVIMAMEEKTFKKGDVIIQQGDDGDNLYVIDHGELSCYRRMKADDPEPTFLKKYVPGDAFGELALLYNAPRAATIIAEEDCILFALDRETFNHIVKGASQRKRETYEGLLSKIELLDSMDPYERGKLADTFRPMKFKAGECVVKEGDKGDVFFFVADGEAIATKLQADGSEQQVFEYKTGDYFGELALLKDAPRAASVIAKTDLNLVSIDRYSFKRLLGPLDDILKRNFKRYEKFASLA